MKHVEVYCDSDSDTIDVRPQTKEREGRKAKEGLRTPQGVISYTEKSGV